MSVAHALYLYLYLYPGGGLSGAPGPHLPGGHPGQPPGHQRGEDGDSDDDDNGDLNHALLAGEDLQQALRPHLHHHRLPRRGGPPARPPRPAALCCVRGQSIQILSMGKFEHFIYQYQTKELFNKHHIMIN